MLIATIYLLEKICENYSNQYYEDYIENFF